jgi:acyl-coenzyme A thioesterase 13
MPVFSLEWLKKQIGKETTVSPSPFARWLRGVLLEAEAGAVKVQFEIRPEMSNPMGILHGGVIAGMMDDILGMAVLTLNHSNFYATINLSTDYLASAKIGEKVIAQAKIIRDGKQIIHAEAELWSENDKLLAKSSTNLAVTSIQLP